VRDPRKAPDRRSPVQPARADAITFIVLAVVGVGAVWSLREAWIDPYAVPYETDQETGASSRSETSDRPTLAEPARGNLTRLFTGDDYPMEALQREEQGTVTTSMQIDKRGRVNRCTVTVSSGSRSLDSRTCQILRSRARFAPARDKAGRAIADVYTQRITWRLE
jgi:TonB family protein